jgi:CHAT domain-containing protein
VQPYLDSETVLVEYFEARDRLVAFVVGKQELHAQRLPADLNSVFRTLRLLWLNLKAVPRSRPEQVPGLRSNALGLLRQLYQRLVAPLENLVGDAPKLIVVPHGPLHYLPWHALFDGKSHLLERHAMSYLPNGSLLRFVREARPSGTDHVCLGHSNNGALPHAVSEARAIAALLKGYAYVEDEATLARLRETAPKASILHIAAHGEYRPDSPLFSGLSIGGGWFTTLDVFRLPLSASLVTLSACQTGRNVIGGGDELLGLMRAFIYAGAASLVGSLWAIEDASAARLMERFYQGLVSGQGKAEALRKAQLELVEDGNGPHSHPYYWAPFFLTGDEGVLLQANA